MARRQPDELDRSLATWLDRHAAALRVRWQALAAAAPAPPELYDRALQLLQARLRRAASPPAAVPADPLLGEAVARLLPAAEALLREQPDPAAAGLTPRLADAVLALVLELGAADPPSPETLCASTDDLLAAVAEPVAVVAISDGRILAANQAALDLTGYGREGLTQVTADRLHPRLTPTRLAEVRERLAQEGDLFFERYPLRRAEGDSVDVSLHVSLVEHDGQPALLIVLQPEGGPGRPSQALAAEAERIRAELAASARDERRLRLFYQNVIDALPLRLLVLDGSLRVLHANPAYYQQRGFTRQQVIGQHINEVFTHELLEDAGLRRALEGTLATGERVWWSGFREYTPGHPERIVNIRIDPCKGPDDSQCLLVAIEDVSERYRQIYERSLLQEVSRVMLGTLELPRLLHAILTGMSAGGAAGLGFNRAVLMLVDEDAGVLQAEMAVGPENAHQAQHIWSEISGRYRTLQDFLQDYDRLPPPEQRPLADLVSRLVVPLDDLGHLPISALATGETVHVLDASHDPRVNPEFARLLESEEFVIAPLLVGERRIGVAVADNLVTRRAIRGSDIHLLTSLANQAALAIDRAQTHRVAQERAAQLATALDELRAAEQELLRGERLATIGQVTAAVAHEIRNPLSTIGGFARSIVRDPGEIERNQRSAAIIVDEANRLEDLLRGLLDFSRPESVQLQRQPLTPIIQGVLELTADERRTAEVEAVFDFPPDLPEVYLDTNQFRRVLLNLVKNALEAMPAGGCLILSARATERGVELRVSDTGSGIRPEDFEHIFDTYFTTKPTGTGLGLALARKILDAHHATIEVLEPSEDGATFVIILPRPADVDQAAQTA